jgi:hypothetical protein
VIHIAWSHDLVPDEKALFRIASGPLRERIDAIDDKILAGEERAGSLEIGQRVGGEGRILLRTQAQRVSSSDGVKAGGRFRVTRFRCLP